MYEADTTFVGNLWARRRIDDLLTAIEDEGETPRRRSEVVELATTWGIVTPYTSYLAVDPSEQQQVPQPDRWFEDNRRSGGFDLDAPMGGAAVDELATGQSPGQRFPRDGAPMEETESDSMRGRGAEGFGRGDVGALSGATGGARPTSSARPAAEPAPAVPMRRQDTGREAVEASIARAENRNSMVVTGQGNSSTFAAGRAFERVGGVWVETSIAGRSDNERIAYMSDEYFALLRDQPDLREVLALGDRVRFSVGSRVIEITP